MNANPVHPDERSNAWDGDPGAGPGARRSCGAHSRWTPPELVAMVLGFVLFWPIGLAILGWKIWQRRSGYPGDLRTFADERIEEMRGVFKGCGSARRHEWAAARWGAAEAARSTTGNRAFDDWKASELARLEEERRKLDEAQREFADYMGHLRQARDRQEFERFVSERDAAKARGEAGWRPFPEGPASGRDA